MSAAPPSLEQPDAYCWQCGAPANPGSAFRLKLVARSSRGLDPLGHPVDRSAGRDKLTILVPRCANCRSRSWLSIAIVILGLIAGEIAYPILRRMFLPWLDTPDWSEASFGWGGLVGSVVALLGVAIHRVRTGRRSLNSYPSVVALRKVGWSYQA